MFRAFTAVSVNQAAPSPASARGPAKWPGLTSVFTGLPAAAGELYFMHDKQGGRQMHIERKLPLVEEILDSFSGVIGADLPAYRNHVYRVTNLCLSLGSFGETEKEKIQVAACFHDIGIWTAGTLDYLSPSEADAAAYLNARGKALWIAEVSEMIEMHHSIRSHAGSPYPLVEPFRRADIADFSLGMVPMGISKELIATLKVAFPNSGFHKRLAQLGSKWFLRHPLNPLPMFRR